MKPYYEHAGITIFHGDCAEIVPSLPDDCESCDLFRLALAFQNIVLPDLVRILGLAHRIPPK